MAKKLKLAWFSPLNFESVSPSVSAYFSDMLLPLLAKKFEIDLFYNGFRQYRDFKTFHYLKAFARHKGTPYDIFFYQLEDKKISDFVRCHIGLIPGITLFHDFLLTTHGPEPLLNSPYQDVVAQFNGSGAGWPERGKEYVRNSTLAERETSLSPIRVFSSERNLKECQRNITLRLDDKLSKDVIRDFYLPYPVDSNLSSGKNGKGNILFCGTPRIEHRAHKLLNALSEFKKPFKLIWLVEDQEVALANELLKEFKIQNFEIVSGRSPQRFSELVKDAEIAVHTLFSAYGQPGPYLAISLMAGIPTIVNNFGSTEYLPENVVFKVQAGESEAFEIKNILEKILSSAVFDYSESQKVYAREQFDSKVIANELSSIFENSANFLAGIMNKWKTFESQAADSLIKEVAGLMEADCFSVVAKPVFEELGWNKI